MSSYDGYPSVVEADGIERPGFVPVSAFRPEVKYVDYGRVLAMGRLYRVVRKSESFLGFIYVHDEGDLFASPDRVADGKYHALRWVGGFKNRQECVQYLRAHQDARSEWWKEAESE